MESNASRIRRLIYILVISIGWSASTYAQIENEKTGTRYGHMNVGLSANESILFTDSLSGLGYDFGIGANLEYEMFFTDKLSVLGGAGVSFLRSSTRSKSSSLSLIAADLRAAAKYSLNGKIHILAGPTLLYNIKTRLKTSYIDETWESVNFISEIQFGAFVGVEANMNDWSALRALSLIRSESVSFELALIITPQIVIDK
ncbi:MAG: hypothetical protein C0599_08160 [Salinivirgaceae bacterium]|nr:MAG: hypothetical protein C0599_08160 [Salinivirgaceae bacterium]